jgi:hypothetical protein
MFAGLMPLSIRKIYPNLWESDEESDINNRFEADLLKRQLSRLGNDVKMAYEKINNLKTGRKLVDNIGNYMNNQLVVLVYNFMDILSHARTDLETIRELANDETAYRTLTLSWFQHSYLFDLFKSLAQLRCKIIITTDHGSIKVNNAIKLIGDKETTVNLRYKQGRNLNYNPKEVFEVTDPEASSCRNSTLVLHISLLPTTISWHTLITTTTTLTFTEIPFNTEEFHWKKCLYLRSASPWGT